ncbi:DUF2514 family protein [Massilia sp. ZL223]|uniref:DUF2514 family protein n=1 Tax=Massilia sp. ZL223 TaxID=2824904 RepID=UPI001B8441BD|nr:DUF2514 family protein [Massilia sp. ZL223]MBQ5963135.1 DUF2514 family protein [Massilia sp. ZL223]
MMRAESILAGLVVSAGLLVLGALGVIHYGGQKYEAGYNAAVADGEQSRKDAERIARETENDLRNRLRAQDIAAHRKEQEHATRLEAAQRRVRAGVDRLRCPAGPVSVAAASGDRPVAGGPASDGQGAELVPEVAADLLGLAADVGGLVRRYDRLVERFEECRAVSAK